MASSAFSQIRQWTSNQQRQPDYEALSFEEHGEEEPKEDPTMAMSDGSGLLSGSTPSTPGQGFTSSGPYGGQSSSTAASCLRCLFLFPALILHLVSMAYHFVTEPIRRRGHRIFAAWTPIYAKLGTFQHLVPSFLQPTSDDGKPSRKLHPSAWLDGLRGTAAFLVVWHHASLLWFSWRLHHGYGSAPENNLFIQMPIIRIVLSGPPQVAVFFVISGYALSYKPLRLARQGRFDEAGEAIHSSIFRRHPRLFLMPVFVSFIAAIMIHLDLYGTSDSGWAGVATPERRPPRTGTLLSQLADWLKHVRHLTNPLSRNMDRGRPFGYDPNLWTLPVEFDCSMIVFGCQAAFNRLRPRVRMALLLGLMVYAEAYVSWRIFLFLSGMFLCDLHFQLDGTGAVKKAPTAGNDNGSAYHTSNSNTADALPDMTEVRLPEHSIPLVDQQPGHRSGDATTDTARSSSSARLAFTIVSVFVALYLLSMPDKLNEKSTGFKTLTKLVPEGYKKSNQPFNFWISIGAVMLIFIIDRTLWLQRIFTTAFAQYLGTISYSMYLVHGPLIWSAGHWLVRHTTAITGTETETQYFCGIVFSAALLWPVIIYCADAVTRGVDVRAVAIGRWLYERWSVKEATAH